MTEQEGSPRWLRFLLAPVLIAAGIYFLWDLRGSGTREAQPTSAPTTVLADSGAMALARTDSLRLHGNEPFWSVDITPEGILYRTPENMDGVRFPPAPAQAEGSGRRYSVTSTAPESHTLEISVLPGSCSDGMSDSTYPFTVRVVMDQRELRGCGRPMPPPQR
jgi:uncharacterized membrane protein